MWDYPRPPRLEPVPARIRIVFGGVTIVDTVGAYRVLETSHPPNYYLPPGDVLDGCLTRTSDASFCEWKGTAHYFDVAVGDVVAPNAAWGYDHPNPGFEAIAGFVAFYAEPMDACMVGDEQVEPQRLQREQRHAGQRLDHAQPGRPVQGRPRHARLVAPPVP